MRKLRCVLLLAAALTAVTGGGSVLSAQGVGSIRGRVVEENTQRPLSGVQLTVLGTGRGALSDAAGNYVIANVPAGTRTLRAEMLGYSRADRSLVVAAGQAVVADFRLAQQAVSLSEIVVTGTPGAVQKKMLGNTVTTINASDVNSRVANQTVVELLAAKTPGLTISGGSGTAGTAQNIKIRGTTSLSAGNQPVVYVDGVKVATGSLGNFVPNCCNDGASAQRTDALGGVAPEDIESIEVIKGPAAATLYGADAAAGVIQIITKKGKPGQQKLQWNAKLQYGGGSWGVAQPVNYTLCDAPKLLASGGYPGCVGQALNTRLSQNVMTADPNELRTGRVSNYALSVRGGGDNYSFYIAGTYDDEQGVLYNNYFKRRSIRSNFAFNPVPKLDFTVNFGFTNQHVRLPKNDNDANGIMFNAMNYRPGRANPWGNNLTPDTANMYDNQTDANQLILGTTANYRPFSWFKNRVTIGYNQQVSRAQVIYPPGRVAVKLAADITGYVQQQIPQTTNYTVDYAGTISRALGSGISSDLSFGMQLLANRYNRLYADGLGLASQFTTLIGSAAKTTGAESFSESNSLGLFAQEQVGLSERIFLTAGVRMDNNSVFGTDVKRIFYPKVSGSWVLSDEPWFHLPQVSNLRVRAAWGQAGKAPDAYTATRTYTAGVTTLSDGSPVSAVLASTYGNPGLEPERGTEIEAGFDAAFLGGRAGIEFTFYNKHMTNGIIGLPVAPSTGFTGTFYDNLLNMTNRGVEATLRGTPLQLRKLSWDATLTLATNANKLNSFGYNRKPSLTGYYSPVQGLWPGYPVYGFWARRPKLDASGNVVIVNGIAQAGDTVYVGSSTPTREIGFSNTFTLFRNLAAFVLLDYKGGFYQFNVRDFRRNNSNLTDFMTNPSSDPTEVAIRHGYPQLTKPWIQPADFIKLRDVSLTYTIPARFLQRFGTERASLTLAAHNVGILWTRYGGLDPEANFDGADDFNRNDAWTMPQLRRITASLNVSF